MSNNTIKIFTDGSSLGNPGPGGYGVVLISGKHRKDLNEGFRLTTNNRMELLIPTCESYLLLYADYQGEVKATVTSAVVLSPELEEKVLLEAKKLSDKKAILENIIDPSIIGGYILKIGDMQYDASIAQQLKSIKTTLTKTNSI